MSSTPNLNTVFPSDVGLSSAHPSNFYMQQRAPLTTDYKNFKIGDMWLDYPNRAFYQLANKTASSATWVPYGGSTIQVEELTPDSGGAVTPVNSNINIEGDATQGITTTNNTSPNLKISAVDATTAQKGVASFNNTQFSVTSGAVSLVSAGSASTSFVSDSGTATPSTGVLTIKGQNPANASGIKATASGAELDLTMFSPFVGNFNFTSATSGATETLTIDNSSNTASSAAELLVKVAGGTAADPVTMYTVNGVTNWTQGIDNSVNDNYVVAASTALGTTDVIEATTTGFLTYPLQPAFSVYLASSIANATGDGTAVTVLFDTADTNRGTVYATGSGVFTVPANAGGLYLIVGSIGLGNLGAGHTSGIVKIITSARTYVPVLMNPIANAASSSVAVAFSTIVPLAAANTASIQVTVSGSTKTVSLLGSADANSYFMGYKLC